MILSYSSFRWMARLLGGVAAMGAFALAASTANAATITVTTALDEFDLSPNATCSLREAIESANRNSNFGGCNGDGAYGADIIQFAPGISVITLTITSPVGINNDNNAYLDLDVVVDSAVTNIFTLTIQGSSNAPVKVIRDFNSAPQFSDRIFDILTPTLGLRPGGVRFAYLFIEAGQAIGNEETVSNDHPCHQGGAGVRHRSGGLLEIERGTVSFNFANGNGGGICQVGGQLRVLNYTYIFSNTSQFYNGGGFYISGTAELTATIEQNKVEDDGGGIYIASNGVVTITNSDVYTNTATNGGGVYNAGQLTLNGGKVMSNTARANGGGVWNSGQLTMNTEVRANSAVTDGGGIWTSGVLNIVGNAVHSNTAQNGGGVWNSGQLTINTEVRANKAMTDGGGIWNNGVLSIIGNAVHSNQAQNGGGVFNSGSAMITNAGVHTNTASLFGGGLWNSGVLTVTSAGLRANVAAGLGGGIYNAPNGQTLVSSAGIGEPGAGNQAQKGGGVYNAISATLTITSAGVHSNTASAEGGGVYNESGGVVSISNSGIGTDAGNSAQQNGGGIWNNGVLTLTSATVASNTASQNGGGVVNASNGNATVAFARVNNNQAQGNHGGGVYNTGALRLYGTQVAGNSAAQQGGGLYNDASNPGSGLVVTNSAVVSNTANQGGGGYHLSGTLVMTNATLSGNSGGGLHAGGGDARLWFVTVASNTAGNGISATAGVQVYATLLAYNASTNCAGTVTDSGYSMSSDSSCSGFASTNVDPKLKPLALNGGGTLNHALSLGSPAVDRVPSTACPVNLDQRYSSRPWWWTNRCDIGAFELQPYYPVFAPIVRRP
jgi:CSLREA domain-containing protein